VKLELYAEKLGICDRIEFVGFQLDPYIYISKAQLLVLSSDHEGFGNVIVEALYCGLSVVSTDSGSGIHDILLDGKYGTIVPCNDKIALSQAIISELKVGRDSDQQKQSARRFLPRKIAKDFLEVIE
jgi:glycosyltransferase involved in cell wall biosynthesis